MHYFFIYSVHILPEMGNMVWYYLHLYNTAEFRQRYLHHVRSELLGTHHCWLIFIIPTCIKIYCEMYYIILAFIRILPIPHTVTKPPIAMPVALCVNDSTDVNCGLYMVRWGDIGRPSLAFLASKPSLSLGATFDALPDVNFNLQGKDVMYFNSVTEEVVGRSWKTGKMVR